MRATTRRRRAAALRLRDRRGQEHAHRPRPWPTRPMPSRTAARSAPSRTAPATRSWSRSTCARSSAARRSRPGTSSSRATSAGTRRATRTSGRSSRARRRWRRSSALADACTRGGMPTHALADARGAQWRKLIFNAASNAIGALTGTHARAHRRAADARPRLGGHGRGPRRRGRAGDHAGHVTGGAVRLRGAQGGRVRPQAVDAAGRRGRPADRDRLPERRRSSTSASATASTRRSTGR